MELTFNYPNKFAHQAKDFFEAYELIDVVLPIESNKKKLKRKSERKCRFCGNSMPVVKFNSEAHLIPHLLGTDLIFSDFECDVCNKQFGTYEDHFAKMIEPERPLNKVKKKTKHPKFTSPNEEVVIEVQNFYDNQSIQISRERVDDDAMTFTPEEGKFTIKYKKNSYSLNKVYRCFMKMAYSILSEEEVIENYKLGIDYILDLQNKKLSGCRVTGYKVQYPFKFPLHLLLFKKRNPTAKTITHVMVLYVMNYVFSIPLLLNKNDFWFYNQEIKAIDFPPLFIQKFDFNTFAIHPFENDFTSDELVKGMEDGLDITFDKNLFENLVGFNPKTGELISHENFNPNDIVKVIIMEGPSATIDIHKQQTKS